MNTLKNKIQDILSEVDEIKADINSNTYLDLSNKLQSIYKEMENQEDLEERLEVLEHLENRLIEVLKENQRIKKCFRSVIDDNVKSEMKIEILFPIYKNQTQIPEVNTIEYESQTYNEEDLIEYTGNQRLKKMCEFVNHFMRGCRAFWMLFQVKYDFFEEFDGALIFLDYMFYKHKVSKYTIIKIRLPEVLEDEIIYNYHYFKYEIDDTHLICYFIQMLMIETIHYYNQMVILKNYIVGDVLSFNIIKKCCETNSKWSRSKFNEIVPNLTLHSGTKQFEVVDQQTGNVICSHKIKNINSIDLFIKEIKVILSIHGLLDTDFGYCYNNETSSINHSLSKKISFLMQKKLETILNVFIRDRNRMFSVVCNIDDEFENKRRIILCNKNYTEGMEKDKMIIAEYTLDDTEETIDEDTLKFIITYFLEKLLNTMKLLCETKTDYKFNKKQRELYGVDNIMNF